MEILVCGNNVYNQLNFSAEDFACGSECGNGESSTENNVTSLSLCDKGKSSMVPVKGFLLSDAIKVENIHLFFTWSRCFASFEIEDCNCLTLVTGFNSKEWRSIPDLRNSLCLAATEQSVLLKEHNRQDTILGLQEGISQPFSLSVRTDENAKSTVKLQRLVGGHKDFYAVYDGVSFGKFSLQDTIDPSCSESHSHNENSTSTLYRMYSQICHIDSVVPIKEISCGKEHVLLLTTSGNVYSYGLSSRGQLGHGEVERESSPRLIDALDGLVMKSVVAGGWHSAAISEIGDLYVWGWNESGQLGLGSLKTGGDVKERCGMEVLPVCLDVPDGENVKDAACGSRHTVVLTESSQILACGWNAYGQLGLGDTTSRDTLTKVDGLTGCRVFAGHWNSAFVCKKRVSETC